DTTPFGTPSKELRPPKSTQPRKSAEPDTRWRISSLPSDWRIRSRPGWYRLAPMRLPGHNFCGAFFRRSEGEIAMTRSAEETRNRFDSMSVPGLSSRAQDAVNAALEAMSNWRSEAAENSEKNMKRVIGKMAAAAAELGWPEQIVDTARTQLQHLTEMQIKTM